MLDRPTTDTLDLRPLPVTRFASMLPAAVPLLLIAATTHAKPPWLAAVLDPLVVAISCVVAVRGFRMGVHCTSDTIVVRGLCRSRRIRIAQIDRIGDRGPVTWHLPSGRRRRTPILAFYTQRRTASFVARHNAESIAKLRDWTGRPSE